MKDTTKIVGMNGNLWNDIKIEDIELEWYDNFGFTLEGDRVNMKSYHVRIRRTWDENTNFFQIHHIEYKKLERIIEEYNETKKEKEKDMNAKNEIRDGWYKIKNQKDIDGGWKLCYVLERDLPKHRIIKIVDGFWHGWLFQPEVILHEWFEYGECVYVRNSDTTKWVKAKYHSYSSVRSSQLAVVSGCVDAWNYCISEAEWKAQYDKPIEIQIIDGSSCVVKTLIRDNEKIIIKRCGNDVTYETEKIIN